MWYKDYKSLFQVDMVKHELGVTSCELRVTSYELKALKLQLKFKSESSNSRVRIHELQVQFYYLLFQIHELQV